MSKKKEAIGDLVAVTWVDACKRSDWSEGDPLHPPVAVTYGELVGACKEYVSVASEVFSNGNYRDVTTIPRGMVEKVRKLKSA